MGDGKFQGVFLIGGLPGDGWHKGDVEIKTYNKKVDDGVLFEGEAGTAKIVDGKITIHDSTGEEIGSMEKVERKSPTLGAEPPEGAKVLFGGKTGDLAHWKGGKIVEDDLLLAGTTGTDDLQDFTLHLEFRTPFVPSGRGQGRGNSGLYLQDRYECQILDSFGLEGLDNECGGFYQIKAPDVNMCFPPLSWQTYDIDFTAARFEGDKKVENAKVTVKHNGVVIHDDFELPHLTPGGAATEAPGKGPLQAASSRQPGDVSQHLGGGKVGPAVGSSGAIDRQVIHLRKTGKPAAKATAFAAGFSFFRGVFRRVGNGPGGWIFFRQIC